MAERGTVEYVARLKCACGATGEAPACVSVLDYDRPFVTHKSLPPGWHRAEATHISVNDDELDLTPPQCPACVARELAECTPSEAKRSEATP